MRGERRGEQDGGHQERCSNSLHKTLLQTLKRLYKHLLSLRDVTQKIRRISMRKYLWAIAVISSLVTGASGQSPKYQYEFTKFVESFPNATGKARDTVSVAADGKGTILVLR